MTLQKVLTAIQEVKRQLDMFARTGVSSGQLRAQSFSVMVSSRTKCNAGCQFCISRTTPEDTCSKTVQTLNFPRLHVGLDYAARCGAITAILTGKADPLQEDCNYLFELIKTCRSKMPTVDMHTNGLGLLKGKYHLATLIQSGLTMLTFSIAHHDQKKNAELMGPNFKKYDQFDLVNQARNLGLLVRCSVVLSKAGVSTEHQLQEYISKAKRTGAHQVVVRELWIPDVEGREDSPVWKWNKKNKIGLDDFYQRYMALSKMKGSKVKLVRYLPWGTAVFDVDGVNVTFARCEESFNGGTLKSLVHKYDGHGYMDWDHNGSVLY